VEVAIRRGENRGEKVLERNVVREVKRLGLWRGQPRAYRLPPGSGDGLKTVVVVQQPRGGRVIGVAEKS
jgi:hypothetical protein